MSQPISTILLVDDRPANILALEQMLEKKDRAFLKASSGDEALKYALNSQIDLIILDVQMPKMDGFEVSQILKSNYRTKEIPIIFASAEMKEHHSIMKGFEEGAVDYLFKPLDPEITRAKVAVLLKLQMQKKELIEKNASLERAALLINNSADIIGIVDAPTMKFEQINPAFTNILGYQPDEIYGAKIDSFILEDDRSVLKDVRHSFETRVYCKDRSIKWLQWNIVAKDNKWFVNARDITQIMQLNNDLQSNVLQLESTNKELESFSYSVSHDLRSPLRSLMGYSQILGEDYSEILGDEGKRLLTVIQRNALKMNSLIDDLLEFSRLGKKELGRQVVDMKAIVENLVSEVNSTAKQPVVFNVDEIPSAQADLALITQVWTNLISNAVKYSGKKSNPVVSVSSYPENGHTVYVVKDNGAGFEMSYADKLFGVFQRLHKQEDFEGTGIGLAIIHRVITRHGGKVWAEGKVDEGATFYFSLPD
ncbi:MAG TPA: response regulator [Cyclobacteriaceae bacterium]|nr:response regulator [Cyclobacteriaceae bacterium]